MGDLCTDLQKGGGEKRCPYLPPMSEPTKLNDFRDKALVHLAFLLLSIYRTELISRSEGVQASVRDIEDIEDLGRKSKTCPYYGSRKAVKAAEVVTLPYNMLMQKTARETLGISLKGCVFRNRLHSTRCWD